MMQSQDLIPFYKLFIPQDIIDAYVWRINQLKKRENYEVYSKIRDFLSNRRVNCPCCDKSYQLWCYLTCKYPHLNTISQSDKIAMLSTPEKNKIISIFKSGYDFLMLNKRCRRTY